MASASFCTHIHLAVLRTPGTSDLGNAGLAAGAEVAEVGWLTVCCVC